MIIRAAIKYKGITYSSPSPARHHDVIQLIGKKNLAGETQGFITDEGVFLDRLEGAKHALSCGQIKKLRWPPYLYTDELW